MDPVIALRPEGVRTFLHDAVLEGGGTLGTPESAEGLVWTSPQGSDDLAALLRAHRNIRWVQLPWAGIEPFVDVLDDAHLWTAGQGVYAEPVAEHALTLALAGLRDLKVRAGARSWQKPSGRSLFETRVTLFGAGGITRALLAHLAPFRCAITVVRRRPVPVDGAQRTISFAERAAALDDADVVFLACALTAQTRGMIGAVELSRMRPHAWIINVARGGLIDTAALVEALAAERIGGAALDVTDPEPLPADHPLWTSPRCIITPHVANTPEMAIPLLSERVRENVRRFARGEQLLGVVDVEAGY